MTGLGLGIELTLGGLVLLLGLWFLFPLLARVYLTRRALRLCRDRGLIVITYDDGPSPDVTPKLLKVLDEADVQATFFMTGSSLNQEPDSGETVSVRRESLKITLQIYEREREWHQAPSNRQICEISNYYFDSFLQKLHFHIPR